MTRDEAERELRETAQALLSAMRAGEQMMTISPQASLEKAKLVQREAHQQAAQAMARFKTMCARLAIYAKNGV